MTFTAAIELMRTQAEREDQALSWQRSDRAFFASGGFTGAQMYASDGRWAFDFYG